MSFLGKLDSTVGGSLAAGERPFDKIVRECAEVICLDPEHTRANVRPCGTNSFQMTVNDYLQSGC